jgi:hypothetical protein
MTMIATDNSSNIPYHFVSGPSVDKQYMLLVEIDKTLQGVHSARESLLSTLFANGQGEYIRPVECDHVVEVSNKIIEIAAKVSGKLRSMDNLAVLSDTTYCKLLMHLYSASDKSRKLNELLSQFRSICMETTNQQRSIFGRVQKEITITIRICEQIEAETEELLDSVLLKHFSTYTDRLPA